MLVALAAATVLTGSAPAAPTAADLAVFVAAGANPMPPLVPDGRTATIASLRFTAGPVVEHAGGEEATARVRFEIPAGLRWGSDEPDPSESCAGTATSGECETSPLNANVFTQRSVGWVWDVVAERPGSYVLRAEILGASTSDPNPANNRTSVTVVVTEPLPPPPTPVSVTASAVKLTPSKPKAGGTVAATVRVTADGSPVRPTRVTCAGTVGGARLAGTPSARVGTATCRYRPPKASRGKTLRGTISFSARGKRFTKRFSAKLG